MDHITYHLATIDDVELLTELRAAFVEDLAGKQKEDDVAMISEHLREYFKKAIAEGSYISWYAKLGEEAIGVGGMVLRQQPGSLKNPTGKWGYVMNMYVHPEHRRKGIAAILINKLMDSAREAGYHAFELHATQAGAPLYEMEGFKVHGEPTYRKYNTL